MYKMAAAGRFRVRAGQDLEVGRGRRRSCSGGAGERRPAGGASPPAAVVPAARPPGRSQARARLPQTSSSNWERGSFPAGFRFPGRFLSGRIVGDGVGGSGRELPIASQPPRIFRPFFFYSSSAKLIWRPWKVYPRCPAPLVFETKIGSKSHTHTQTRMEGRKEGKTAAGGQPGDADGNLGGVGCWGLVACQLSRP